MGATMTAFSSAGRAAMLVVCLLSVPVIAAPQNSLQHRIELQLREASPGTRFGLVVATREGLELIAIAPEERFIPASNTKVLTTAAAFSTLPAIDRADRVGGASVRLELDGEGPLDVVLEGRGDARLSSTPDCIANCLATLADAIASRTRNVDNVIGDDSWFPDQRWSPGMSWNNIPTSSGTAISALTVDDNEVSLRVIPTAPGEPPRLELLPYFKIDNRAKTIVAGKTDLEFDRLPGSRVVRLTGTIVANADPELLELGIDDPAHYAAWRLKSLLDERGVSVAGAVAARHRAPTSSAERVAASAASAAPYLREQRALAQLTPPPLIEDLSVINKDSQNVHAELMLRRVGRQQGDGSLAGGIAVIETMLKKAGVPRNYYDLSDGSGMSTYNRIAPRGMVMLLCWIDAQPWGEAWRRTLPIAGVDGTLDDRFKGTLLERRLFAKTGTLNATNALAGHMIAKSGRNLLFAMYANDVPAGGSASDTMDAVLLTIAENN